MTSRLYPTIAAALAPWAPPALQPGEVPADVLARGEAVSDAVTRQSPIRSSARKAL